MSRNRWTLAAFFAGLATLVIAPLALAGSAGWGGRCHQEGPPSGEHLSFLTDKLLDQVDATDEQRVAILAIVDSAVPEMTAIHEEGHALREAFRTAMSEGADAGELEGLRADASALFDRASRTGLDHLQAVRAELTDEQWAQLDELRERMGRFGPRGHHGGPPPFDL